MDTSALRLLAAIPSDSLGVWFPHLMSASPPDSVADGTPNGTQKALTLPVGRPSVFSGDWPRSRLGSGPPGLPVPHRLAVASPVAEANFVRNIVLKHS